MPVVRSRNILQGAITSILCRYYYRQTQLNYLSDSPVARVSAMYMHVTIPALKFFNGAENGANFKFYITNQTDLENDTIRKGISI